MPINNKIRSARRKSCLQKRIFHSLQNSFDKRKSSNSSIDNSELISFTMSSLNNQNKRNLGNYQFISNSLDTFTNDESLNNTFKKIVYQKRK